MKRFEIQNIKITVDNNVVVNDASFSVREGEINIIMGPNGSGKSSLLNGIFGYPGYSIESGRVYLSGEDITDMNTEDKAKKGLFLSMQNLPEFEGVTLVNFLHKAHSAMNENHISILEFHKYVSELAESVGISAKFLERELNTALSGGEKKQSEIIQLLALRPQFAFLDEIDSGVDVDSMKSVFAGIDFLKKEKTGFILVTHNTNILNMLVPDKVHIMKNGSIIQSGGKELVKKVGEFGFYNI